MIELYNSVKINRIRQIIFKPLHAKFGLPFFIHTVQYRYLQILIITLLNTVDSVTNSVNMFAFRSVFQFLYLEFSK